jgi:hypothetical protein
MYQTRADSDCRTVDGREAAGCRVDGTDANTTGAVEAIHRAAGNQAVQSATRTDEPRDASGAAERPDGQVSEPHDGADQPGTEMCARCTRRYRAGKPLNCEECESALQRSTADDGGLGTVDGDPVQPKLTVSDPADAAEREAERVATAVLQQDDPAAVDADGTPVRRRATATDGAAVDQETASQIRDATSGGAPLPRSLRSDFEPRFGRDFSDVRVHTGGEADRAARSIDAAAFTLGSDVVFARGNYQPESESGRAVLAHELTHVVQQNAAVGRAVDATAVHRAVSAEDVSCADYDPGHPTLEAIDTDDPLAEIQTAEQRAVTQLETAIGRLSRHKAQVEQDPATVDDVPDFITASLAGNLGNDPTDASTWTQPGPHSVPTVLTRLRQVKRLFEGGHYKYTCVGDPQDCEAKDWRAYTDYDRSGPIARVYLCRAWWADESVFEQAQTLVHEFFHYAYGDMMRHKHDVDAGSYEELVEDLAIRIHRVH